jgi:L-alanine-DL-glutamate epimerase-like enolase superfamily enzyme
MILHQFDLPIRHVFTISRGSTRVYRALVVELRESGCSGFGEAGENLFYGATIDNMIAALAKAKPRVEAVRCENPESLWAELRPVFAGNTFAQCALDVAVWDLFGKLQGQPLRRIWELPSDRLPLTNYTIGIDSHDAMVAKLREFPDWPIYKIKLGTADDLAIVRRLREETSSVFRVDANGAWTAAETVRNAAAMKPLGVEFIEQPMPRDAWAEMPRVRRGSALPLMADESCQTEDDVERCAATFDGVNVKLVKCGGFTPARRMLDRARQLGLRAMVGCMTESTIGISAIAQLLPMLDYVDMDGAVLLAEDIATGATVDRGRVFLPADAGCGAQLLRRHPVLA